MRRMWIGTGWKMNHLQKDAKEYASTMATFIQKNDLPFTAFVLPPFTSLDLVSNILRNTPVLVGAQNMHWEDQGAFTGEISPLMVKDCGASMVEIGHSERRAYFNESDQLVNRKVLAALKHTLTPIVCIGETLEERKHGVAFSVLASQVKWALSEVPENQVDQVIFAYEPVWAIGKSGVAAEGEYVAEVHAWIRRQIAEYAGKSTAQDASVIYGGSVNQDNMLDYLAFGDVDGLFIGRAAWQAESFIQILLRVKDFVSPRHQAQH